MEQKTKEFSLRKSTIATQVSMAKEGSGPEALGRAGGANPFAELRRMEDQIEGVEASVQAQREVDDVLGRGATGASRAEVEAKFRALEAKAAEPSTSPDVEAELNKLKQRIRVK
jgi:phage shock protein A